MLSVAGIALLCATASLAHTSFALRATGSVDQVSLQTWVHSEMSKQRKEGKHLIFVVYVRHLLSCANLGEFVANKQSWRDEFAADSDLTTKAVWQSPAVAARLHELVTKLSDSGVAVLKSDMFVSSLIRTAETAGLVKRHIPDPELANAHLWAVPYLLEEPAIRVIKRGKDNTPEYGKEEYDRRLQAFSRKVQIDIHLEGVLVHHKNNSDRIGWDALVHKDTVRTVRSIASKFKKTSLTLHLYKKAKEQLGTAGVYAVIAFTHGAVARSMLGLSDKEKDCLGNGGIGIAAYDVDVDVNGDTEPKLRGTHGYVFSGGEPKMRPKEDRKWDWFIRNDYFRYDGFATCAAGSCESFIQNLKLHPSEAQCPQSTDAPWIGQSDQNWKGYTLDERQRRQCERFELAADG